MGGQVVPLGWRPALCASPAGATFSGRFDGPAASSGALGAALALLRKLSASTACCCCCSCICWISASSRASSSSSSHSFCAVLCLYLAHSLASASGSLCACCRASCKFVNCGAEPGRLRFLLLGDSEGSAAVGSCCWCRVASFLSSSCSNCRKSSWRESGFNREAS